MFIKATVTASGRYVALNIHEQAYLLNNPFITSNGITFRSGGFPQLDGFNGIGPKAIWLKGQADKSDTYILTKNHDQAVAVATEIVEALKLLNAEI